MTAILAPTLAIPAPTLNVARLYTVLTDMQFEVRGLKEEVRKARLRAEGIKVELSNIMGRCDVARNEILQRQQRRDLLTDRIGQGNNDMLRLHQDIAMLKVRADELLSEISRLGQGGGDRQLRRERARLLIRIEEKQEQLQGIIPQVEQAKAELGSIEKKLSEANDRYRVVYRELDSLQNQLPSPCLFTRLFEYTAAGAHAQFQLEGDPESWRRTMQGPIVLVRDLHIDIRAGKYRLDKYSDLVGGRAFATVEAIYSALVLGKAPLALELFRLAADPELYFHHIFNVFRVWLLGLYLQGNVTGLRELLRYYRYAGGIRRAYVETMLGILDRQPALLLRGISYLVRYHWEMAQQATAVRGSGLVCVAGLGLVALARSQGLRVPFEAPSLPRSLLAGQIEMGSGTT